MDPGMTPYGRASRSTMTGEAHTSDSESVKKDFESCHLRESIPGKVKPDGIRLSSVTH